MGTFITTFVRAWIGSEEYHEAWYKRSRTWSFPIRFWGRLTIAAAGLCFFLWQQITSSPHGWGSDTFATLVLAITVSQAAGPCFYLLYHWTVRFFLTRHYLEVLAQGRVYFTLKSALCILLMTVLSVLAASGSLGPHWYVKLLVFLLTVPVACFFIFLTRAQLGRSAIDRLSQGSPRTGETRGSKARTRKQRQPCLHVTSWGDQNTSCQRIATDCSQLSEKQVALQLVRCDMDIYGWIGMSARNGWQGNGFNDRCFLKGGISHLNCIASLAGFT